jgi:trans-aconitate 2-methyltransferase
MWDPGQYRLFSGERSRPFFELLARVGATAPGLVADLGCGPGDLTAALSGRWPGADVVGVDSSAEMIRSAQAMLSAGGPASPCPRLRFVQADLRAWRPGKPAGVIIANAVLQWVPEHLAVVSGWPGMLASGGWLAFQVPGNFDQPSHGILRDLAASPRWRPLLRDVRLNRQAGQPADYLAALAGAGCEVDAWETTYLHVLQGTDPVLEWYKGTGLRPVLAALEPAAARDFLAEYGARAREAYPAAPYGTVLPFRRVFVVARRR